MEKIAKHLYVTVATVKSASHQHFEKSRSLIGTQAIVAALKLGLVRCLSATKVIGEFTKSLYMPSFESFMHTLLYNSPLSSIALSKPRSKSRG